MKRLCMQMHRENEEMKIWRRNEENINREEEEMTANQTLGIESEEIQ